MQNISQGQCAQHVAIDPCYKLLPKKLERMEEMQVAAMGKKKWMSEASARKGANLRAPATTKTQMNSQVTKIEWTPVFARGRLRIYVCDPDLAAVDTRHPASLADADNLANFVRHVLPKILKEMKTYGFSRPPQCHLRQGSARRWVHKLGRPRPRQLHRLARDEVGRRLFA